MTPINILGRLKQAALRSFLSAILLCGAVHGQNNVPGQTGPTIKPTAFEPFLQPPAPALAGLWVNTNPGIVWQGGNPTTIASARVHLTASATNYVYINLSTNTILVNTTGFGSNIFPIAIISTNNTQTVGVQDVRPDVFGGGGGGGGSGANIEVNGVSNPDQTIANFVDGSGIHFSNTSGGIVTAAVQGNIVPETVTTSLPSDTGSANAYAACPTPTNPSLTKGLQIPFIPANNNTIASTFNLCGGGAVAIKKQGTLALVANDIIANAPITLTFDGTVWQDPTPFAIVTSITTDSQTAVIGSFTNAATDFQTKGLSQGSQTGTWPFLKNSAGTLRLGDSAILTGNTLQLYGSASPNGFYLTDRVGDYIAGFAGGTGFPGIQVQAVNGTGAFTNWNGTSITSGVNGSTYETLTSTVHTFNNVPNFVNGFTIPGSVLNNCAVYNGTAYAPGACVSGSIATWSGTANQIVNTGTSTNPVAALASPLIPPGNEQITQVSNGSTALSITRKQDSGTPSGNLLLFQTAGLSTLGFVDVFGNSTMPSYTTNGTGAGWNAQAAGTDNGANCLSFLSNLGVTGTCVEGPASIATPWVEVTPNTAPAAFSVVAIEAAAGSPLSAPRHFVQTTDTSSPARIQTADTTVGSAPSGDILTADGGGNAHDSGVLLSSITVPTCATATITQPVTCGGVDSTGLSGNLANTNILSVTVPAGQYQMSTYLNSTAACGGSPSGNIFSAKIAYTDSNGAVTKTIIGLAASATLPSNTTGVVTFWQTSSTATMNVSGTYTTCTTLGGSGTEVVDAHFTLIRLR